MGGLEGKGGIIGVWTLKGLELTAEVKATSMEILLIIQSRNCKNRNQLFFCFVVSKCVSPLVK